MQATSEGVDEQLAAEIVDKLLLTVFPQVVAQAVESSPLVAVGKCCLSVDRPATKVFVSPLSDWVVAFKDETDGVETLVAAGTTFDFAVPGHQLSQREITQLCLVFGKLWDFRRWWRDVFAEYPADNPVAALYRAGAPAWRVLGQKDRHRQESAASELVGIINPHPIVWPDVANGHAVVFGQDWVDESVLGIEEVNHRAIAVNEVDEEADRFLVHRLSKSVGEAFEKFSINAVVLFEVAEIQPVAAEFDGQALAAAIPEHALGLR